MKTRYKHEVEDLDDDQRTRRRIKEERRSGTTNKNVMLLLLTRPPAPTSVFLACLVLVLFLVQVRGCGKKECVCGSVWFGPAS